VLQRPIETTAFLGLKPAFQQIMIAVARLDA